MDLSAPFPRYDLAITILLTGRRIVCAIDWRLGRLRTIFKFARTHDAA
jgi:hypothetical protein